MDFVADIGTSWLGNLEVARHLIERAKRAGANIIKPQWWPARVYAGHPMEREALKCLMTPELAGKLADICHEVGVMVQFSVWEEKAVDSLLEMGVTNFKVACSLNRNFDLIRHIAESSAQVLCISSEGRWSIKALSDEGITKLSRSSIPITWYYCVPRYPTKFHQLKFPGFISRGDGPFRGFSDHTLGWEGAMVATALGADIIEKHIMLDAGELRDEFQIEYAHFPDEVCAVNPTVFAVTVNRCLEVERVV